MSKTTHVFPARSTSPPVCFSFESLELVESGRLSRSSRKSVCSASTGASVNAAKKRERVERAGSRSRSRPGHEGDRKGLEPLVEGLQGAFSTDGIPEEDREKIDDLVANASPPRKTHPFADLGQDTVLAKISDEQHNFAKPGRVEGTASEEVWMITDPSAILVTSASLRESV
jgi:hypothetical protein